MPGRTRSGARCMEAQLQGLQGVAPCWSASGKAPGRAVLVSASTCGFNTERSRAASRLGRPGPWCLMLGLRIRNPALTGPRVFEVVREEEGAASRCSSASGRRRKVAGGRRKVRLFPISQRTTLVAGRRRRRRGHLEGGDHPAHLEGGGHPPRPSPRSWRSCRREWRCVTAGDGVVL